MQLAACAAECDQRHNTAYSVAGQGRLQWLVACAVAGGGLKVCRMLSVKASDEARSDSLYSRESVCEGDSDQCSTVVYGVASRRSDEFAERAGVGAGSLCGVATPCLLPTSSRIDVSGKEG